MNLAKVIGSLATAPLRVGLTATEIGLNAAATVHGFVKQSLGEESTHVVEQITETVPLRGALVGANRVAELTEADRAMGRALARGGPADQLLRPGGLVDMLTAPGGLIDRVSVEGSGLERALAPGGLADRLLAEDGLVERMFAEEGLVDKLTAKNGPLEQMTEAAEILSRLAPAVETLTPTADTLQDAVDTLNKLATSLSGLTDRIPRRRRSARRAVSSGRIEDVDAPDFVEE